MVPMSAKTGESGENSAENVRAKPSSSFFNAAEKSAHDVDGADNASTSGDTSDLIDAVNEIRKHLAASGHSIEYVLPQIVAVGCQSAGKSSVLESFVGREFLPRGTGTVTRRPTVIQMHPSQGEEYATFLHLPGKRFTDFNEVRKEIREETKRDPGPEGFSCTPINLEIHSPKVLKLTVVDLPGIVKVVDVKKGKTTEQVVAEVREMILSYIRPPESIILAVSPANHDLYNSDALDIASIADPMRTRTIGVLTKLDIMDRGTNATDILENKRIPLQKGYVGVLNRSQEDIDGGKDFESTLKTERDFFRNSPYYGHLAHRMGTPYLQRTLQKLLRAHIKQFLPKVRRELQIKLNDYSKQLHELNKKMGDGSMGHQFYIMKQVQEFIKDITIKVLGNSEHVDGRTISAGARIHNKLFTEVQHNLNLNLSPDEEELTIIISSIDAIRTSVSIPHHSLEAVCRRLVVQYKRPLEASVLCIARILEEAIEESSQMLNPYPSMKNEVLHRIQCCLEKEVESTQERLRSHIDAEMFYVNLEHPDFDSASCEPVAPTAGPIKVWNTVKADSSEENAASPEQLVKILKANESMKRKVQYVTTLMMKYLEIVKKQVGDLAVKYIVFFFVNQVLEYISTSLVPSLLESSNLSSLLEDCDDDYRRREDVKSTCSSLKEALNSIESF